ncbi:MAG: ABC transporter substrate-binding protein [Woeseiaceae bacterium]|nr:ABC transporter substrate-binding protein [Woeseiaceae bacterium]
MLPPFNGGHWNPELVELAGGIDVLGAHGKPSSTITWDQVIESKPDVLFIACCGFSSERALEDVIELQTGDEWQQMQAIVNARVLLADGNDFFSRPGPRLVDGLEIMAHALHPDVHPVSPYGSCITVR